MQKISSIAILEQFWVRIFGQGSVCQDQNLGIIITAFASENHAETHMRCAHRPSDSLWCLLSSRPHTGTSNLPGRRALPPAAVTPRSAPLAPAGLAEGKKLSGVMGGGAGGSGHWAPHPDASHSPGSLPVSSLPPLPLTGTRQWLKQVPCLQFYPPLCPGVPSDCWLRAQLHVWKEAPPLIPCPVLPAPSILPSMAYRRLSQLLPTQHLPGLVGVLPGSLLQKPDEAVFLSLQEGAQHALDGRG